jgi:release factor glutamine methyltransferase
VTRSIGNLQAWARTCLREAHVPAAALDADLLLMAAAEIGREALIGYPEREIGAKAEKRLQEMIERRLAHEPVSRILGLREFWGLSFSITEAVLDPRPDSETLVEAGLDLLKAREAPRILDLGTGSGCLLLALLHERTDATGVGVDRDIDAAIVARRNARALNLDDRALFFAGDWAAALSSGCFDMIVSNPPYIESAVVAYLAPDVALYDPMCALDGGVDGFDAYRSIIPSLRPLLRPGGYVVIEGGQDQAEGISKMLKDEAASDINYYKDLSGIVRCVSATFPVNSQKD